MWNGGFEPTQELIVKVVQLQFQFQFQFRANRTYVLFCGTRESIEWSARCLLSVVHCVRAVYAQSRAEQRRAGAPQVQPRNLCRSRICGPMYDSVMGLRDQVNVSVPETAWPIAPFAAFYGACCASNTSRRFASSNKKCCPHGACRIEEFRWKTTDG
jgi:hypothetical protein